MHALQESKVQQVSYGKFILFCTLLMGMILICMVFGGYSSFIRAEKGIVGTKAVLTDFCRERMSLLAQLDGFLRERNIHQNSILLADTLQQAEAILDKVKGAESPLDQQTIHEFEASQRALGEYLRESFNRLPEIADGQSRERVAELRRQLAQAQDNIYVAHRNYLEEIDYFNLRLESFPVAYIARLFGFDKSRYYPPSEQAFLPARKVLP
jgi:LemA protein